jgi:hypothetical protein
VAKNPQQAALVVLDALCVAAPPLRLAEREIKLPVVSAASGRHGSQLQLGFFDNQEDGLV